MTQDNFRKEILNTKEHERQMRDQMDKISRMEVSFKKVYYLYVFVCALYSHTNTKKYIYI